MTDTSPAAYRLEDLKYHFSDPLRELRADYWQPLDSIVDQYADYLERVSRPVENGEPSEAFGPDRERADAWLKQNVVLEPRYERSRDLVVGYLDRGVIPAILK
jgi:hypothetical protein